MTTQNGNVFWFVFCVCRQMKGCKCMRTDAQHLSVYVNIMHWILRIHWIDLIWERMQGSCTKSDKKILLPSTAIQTVCLPSSLQFSDARRWYVKFKFSATTMPCQSTQTLASKWKKCIFNANKWNTIAKCLANSKISKLVFIFWAKKFLNYELYVCDVLPAEILWKRILILPFNVNNMKSLSSSCSVSKIYGCLLGEWRKTRLNILSPLSLSPDGIYHL